MKSLVSVLCLLVIMLISPAVRAQDDLTNNYMHKKAMMDRIVMATANPSSSLASGGVPLGGLAGEKPGVVGDVYLTKDFRISTFWLYDGNKVVQGFASRMDLQRNEFDIHMGAGKGIKALPGSKVRSVVLADSLTLIPKYYVNAQEYKNEENVPYFGFFQILAEGDLSLLKLTTVAFKPADTNPTHRTGSADHRFIKKTELFYAIGAKAMELPGRKGILRLLESHQKEISDYIKLNEINLGDERHLVILFDYYNTLTKK